MKLHSALRYIDRQSVRTTICINDDFGKFSIREHGQSIIDTAGKVVVALYSQLTPKSIHDFFVRRHHLHLHTLLSIASTRARKAFTISPIRRILSNSVCNSSICRNISWNRAISASAISMTLPARSYCVCVASWVCW